MCGYNVDEIDGRTSQLHQQLPWRDGSLATRWLGQEKPAEYVRNSRAEKEEKTSDPGVNFINIFLAAFTHKDPKIVKKTDSLTVLFVLLGSALVQATHKMLLKLTPGHGEAEAREGYQ